MAPNILVIGGVALGPKAASRAKRLLPDSNVTMIEQGSYFSYGGCGIPYYISGEVSDMDELRATAANTLRDETFFKETKGVNVLAGTKAISINRAAKTVTVAAQPAGEKKDLPYDKLVIGTGSTPNIPPVAGRDLQNVTAVTNLETARTIQEKAGHGTIGHAVIVGGGFIGLEVAVALAGLRGIKTTIIEIQNQLLPAQLSPNLAQMARQDLERLGIAVLTGEKVMELKGRDGAVSRVITDKRTLDADLVIFSAGVTPNSRLAAEAGLVCHPRGGIIVNSHMQTSDPDIYAGGDCVLVRNIISGDLVFLPLGSMSNRQGRVIGTNVAGGDEVFEGVVGSWCVKLHEMNASGVGLTERQARQAGFDAVTVGLEQLDRAHFYPEKNTISLEVVVDKKTRRILGLQGFSKDGMSLKARVDAVAAMLQFSRPTINDLSNLEVSYSPPFASSMDVVNTAGNVADNVLSGRHKMISPEEFAELWANRSANGYCFLDSRPAAAARAMQEKYPGEWLNIPIEELHKRIGELPKDRPIAIICSSGLRAYETHLALTRAGFTSVNSAGGMLAMNKRGQKF